ncbi:MAG: exosortase, partial [Anaerolineae bacterium]|nr:exosortase [Anaerolineae bacterium]
MQTPSHFHTILFLGMLLLFAPTWLWLGEAWLSNPYYSHGPLVVIVALYFAWVQAKTLGDVARAPNPLGWGILVAALAFHLWATFWRAYYLSALMIPLALLGLLLTLFGWRAARHYAFPLAFLVLMVPLPIAERIGPLLEQWTTTSAVALTQIVGIRAHNVGAQVFLPNATFTIGIPCGGLRSAIAIITLTTLFAYILHGPFWARLALFLAAV